MKKKRISPLHDLLEVAVGFVIIIVIAFSFSKCNDEEKHQLQQMQADHSDKGMTSIENGLLIIHKAP